MNFYLKIEGASAENWTLIEGFNFDFVNFATRASNAYSQPNPPEFGEIQVGLTNATYGPSFLKLLSGDLPSDIVIRATLGAPGALVPTYDLRLNDVVVQNLLTSQFAGPQLRLTYADIAINTYDLDLKTNTATPGASFDWDVKNNDTTPTDMPNFPAFTNLDAPNQPTQFMMAINGLSGSSTEPGREGWFTLLDFNGDFSASEIGKGFGSPRFSVFVEGTTGLTNLLGRTASNAITSALTITSIDGGTITSKYQFAGVEFDNIVDDGDAGFRIDFSFAKIVTTTTNLDSKGNVVTEVAGFDVVAGKEITTLADATTTNAPVVASEATQYYLALNGFRGESADAGHQGWFVLDQMEFEMDGTTGQPDFRNVLVSLNTDTGIANFIQKMTALDPTIKSATIHGVDSKGNTVYGLDLADVRIGDLQDFADGGLNMALDFTKVEVTTFGYDAKDALTAAGQFGWDVVADKGLGSLASAAPTSTKAQTPVAPQKYFMIVDGMTGGGTEPGWTRAFELTDFNFSGFDQGFAGAEFDAVSVQTLTDAGLWSMLRAAHLGNVISGVRIEGVADVGGKWVEVSELVLSGVQVASVQERAGPGFNTEFDFARFTLRTFDALTGKQTASTGYDRVTDTTFTGSTKITPAINAGEAQATDFVFSMVALTSDNRLKGFEGTTTVVDFSFGVTLPSLEGTKQGQSELSHLTLQFDNDGLLAPMLDLMNRGKITDRASLFGLADVGGLGKLEKVSHLALGNVFVTRVTDIAGAGFSVDLDFTKYELQQSRQDPVTGQLKGTSSFGWDDVLNSQAKAIGAPQSAGIGANVEPTDYYMALDGVFGDLTGTARGGWLKLTDMVFATQSRDAVGVVPISAVFTVNLASDRGLAQLMEALASGTPLAAAQIEGTADTLKAGQPFAATVLAYLMNEVYVTKITEDADRGFAVTFEVARYGVETFALNGSNKKTVQYDIENKIFGPTLVPVNLAGLAGNETLAGGAGADVLNGLGGNDILLGNGGADSLIGDLGNDSLDGGADADTLNGGTNNDTLRGGTGADMLTGAAGIDRFVFDNNDSGVGTARDVITDFNRSQGDKIDLIALSPGVLAFVTGAFTGLGQVRVAALDATTSVVQVNLTGDTTPDYEIRLDNNPLAALFTASDFAL